MKTVIFQGIETQVPDWVSHLAMDGGSPLTSKYPVYGYKHKPLWNKPNKQWESDGDSFLLGFMRRKDVKPKHSLVEV